MPLVNLINEQRLGVKQRDSRARAFFFAFVGITTISVLAVGIIWLKSESLDGQVSDLRKRVARIEPIVQQIDTNNSQLGLMSPKLTTLQTAQEGTIKWIRILDHLSKNTPHEVWLTSIRCLSSDPTKPIAVSIMGIGSSQEVVAQFHIRLQTSGDLENVVLKLTQEKPGAQKKGTEFEISADLAGSEQQKPKDEQKA